MQNISLGDIVATHVSTQDQEGHSRGFLRQAAMTTGDSVGK